MFVVEYDEGMKASHSNVSSDSHAPHYRWSHLVTGFLPLV